MLSDIFEKIKKLLQEKLPFGREAPFANFDITPHRDWFILVMLMIIIGAVLVGAAVYMFVIINDDEGVGDLSVVGKDSFESVRALELRDVLQMYSEKEKQFEALFDTPPDIIDPSL